jgi:hypothetical protein
MENSYLPREHTTSADLGNPSLRHNARCRLDVQISTEIRVFVDNGISKMPQAAKTPDQIQQNEALRSMGGRFSMDSSVFAV